MGSDMKHIADMTKVHESVRFVWYDSSGRVGISRRSDGQISQPFTMVPKEDGREMWTALAEDGFTPVMLTGRDVLGNRLGTLPDGAEVTEFPGGGWALHRPGTENLYDIVGY